MWREGIKELVASGWQESELAEHFCRDIRTIRHYLKIASWSEEIHNLLRAHPALFSARIILRQFAYKKFLNERALKSAIQSTIKGKKTVKTVSKKAASVSGIDKKNMRVKLDTYLNKQHALSHVIKDEIEKAFKALSLI